MRLHENVLSLSATDLSNFLGCRHRTALDMSVAYEKRKGPHGYVDPLLELLWQRGLEHEKKYVDYLEAKGNRVVDLKLIKPDRSAHLAATVEACRSGSDVIVQGALGHTQWFGHPDIIQRIERPSALGDWSYEVADTKLARETRAGTILQLGLYSEMLADIQGTRPEFFRVITPEFFQDVNANPNPGEHKYRIDDYAAYFRLMQLRMQQMTQGDSDEALAQYYPEPVEHCEICPWCPQCIERWRADDHLSLVYGISRLQRRELESHRITTLKDLGGMELPLTFKPSRGNPASYERIREQARLQFLSRNRTPPLHELRKVVEGLGFFRLPEPSAGDVFLDLEGDPFAAEGGREYLFGMVTQQVDGTYDYESFWAFNEHDERLAFESVMDFVARRIEKYPDMHVYHYAPYEPSTFKRLMGRCATREEDLDRLLRAERFVDLFRVVQQAVIAGIERYSIKNLEVFYGFEREIDLKEAGRNLRTMEYALELKSPELVTPEVREAVAGYNRDDCVSTLKLRDWLEGLRSEAIATGTEIPRPVPKAADPSAKVDEKARQVDDLRRRVLAGVPEDRAERSEEQQARWLLAYMLDWHRREDKAVWWEYFRLCKLSEEDLLDEADAIAGLKLIERVGPFLSKKGKPTGSVIDRYQYPIQEMEIDRGDGLKLQDQIDFGSVVAVDRFRRTVDIKKGKKLIDVHPSAVFAFTYIDPGAMEQALLRLGERVSNDGCIVDGKLPSGTVARDLLLRRLPRLRNGNLAAYLKEDVGDAAVKIVNELDETFLAIQGPPGSGKTYTGARMICALVNKGKKVGVIATGHKVIRNLLNAVDEESVRSSISVKLAHKGGELNEGTTSAVAFIGENDEALEALQSGEANVLGGTAWMWARPEFERCVDVLFVDEAGQMSLANVLAVAGSAKSIVLLGDPQQLDQPKKGSHPEGVGASALQHILGPHQTIENDRGIFFPITWRLHPSICAFTSELFYESKLQSKPGLEHQSLNGESQFPGSGLWMMPVDHDGNCNSSDEEVDVVANLVNRLIAPGSRWIDERGASHQLTMEDVLIVAPYNAQVSRIAERLGADARVGTVDKFQGQQAPVVIYSATTSRPEDAPRGMEFLYSPNRLNVATSRARCATILVASPRLFEPDCRTPRQMHLANAFCRYREMAKGA
jgi:predicted RecB family nuclease